MTLKEGPLLGAVIIGAGVGFLVFQKFDILLYALGAGLAVGVGDYVLLGWVDRWRKKK